MSEKTEQVNFEPCPFCGGSASLSVDEYINGRGWVSCHECDADGPLFNVNKDERANEKAIMAWNTRHTPDRERIKQAVKLLESIQRFGIDAKTVTYGDMIKTLGVQIPDLAGEGITLLKQVLEKE